MVKEELSQAKAQRERALTELESKAAAVDEEQELTSDLRSQLME